MIKKLIGIIIAVAVIAIIVLTAMHRDNFHSMLFRDEILNQTLPAPIAPTADGKDGDTASAPTTAEISLSDSVTVDVVDMER